MFECIKALMEQNPHEPALFPRKDTLEKELLCLHIPPSQAKILILQSMTDRASQRNILPVSRAKWIYFVAMILLIGIKLSNYSNDQIFAFCFKDTFSCKSGPDTFTNLWSDILAEVYIWLSSGISLIQFSLSQGGSSFRSTPPLQVKLFFDVTRLEVEQTTGLI